MIQGGKRKSTYVSIFLDNLIVTIGEAVWGFVLDHERFYYTLKSISDKKVAFKSFMDFLTKKEKDKKGLLWSFMACFQKGCKELN